MSSDNEDVASVRRRVSIVWKYFEKLSKERIRCRLCHHEQNYQGTTGNILRHLKNKHNIDASLKGQQQHPQDIKNIESQLESTEGGNLTNFEKRCTILEKRQRTELFEEYIDINPYNESTIQNLGAYVTDHNYGSNNKRSVVSKNEERLLAEIEYYKEKAGFYRMQKNLIALQAKKIKYELDHMS